MKRNKQMKTEAMMTLLLVALITSFCACSSEEFEQPTLTLATRAVYDSGEPNNPGGQSQKIIVHGGHHTFFIEGDHKRIICSHDISWESGELYPDQVYDVLIGTSDPKFESNVFDDDYTNVETNVVTKDYVPPHWGGYSSNVNEIPITMTVLYFVTMEDTVKHVMVSDTIASNTNTIVGVPCTVIPPTD